MSPLKPPETSPKLNQLLETRSTILLPWFHKQKIHCSSDFSRGKVWANAGSRPLARFILLEEDQSWVWMKDCNTFSDLNHALVNGHHWPLHWPVVWLRKIGNDGAELFSYASLLGYTCFMLSWSIWLWYILSYLKGQGYGGKWKGQWQFCYVSLLIVVRFWCGVTCNWLWMTLRQH